MIPQPTNPNPNATAIPLPANVSPLFGPPQPQIGQTMPELGTATSLNASLPMSSEASPDGTGERKSGGYEQEQRITSLGAFIHKTWDQYKTHDFTIHHREDCLRALRVYKGKYSEDEHRKIRQFGGSSVFSHITSTKCRGATALLRDIFLGQEQAWGIDPTRDPNLPEDITESVGTIVQGEVANMQQQGVRVPQEAIEQRIYDLMTEAQEATEKKAQGEAKRAEKQMQDILTEGGFYDALVDFITDLPIYPLAILKGPVVKQVADNKWVDGKLQRVTTPRMCWYRVSPFDLYFTPGASSINDASTIEFSKTSRAELNALIGLPGYDEAAIRQVLRDYTGGYVESRANDTERAWHEGKEDPHWNQSELIDSLEWQGAVHGQMLLDYGYTAEQIPDADRDYFVTAWVIGQHVIKVLISPDAKQRPNYYATSFEKVPGALRGLALPQILGDVQRMANGCLRALANNMAMSSGPQVAISESRLASTTDADSMYPWKRWRFMDDPMITSANPAISFFQPQSNAQELLTVYQAMTNISDETSSIPRYLTGNERVGGAGRTASGLSMLMNSASKMMQVVASNIDRDVMRPALERFYDMMMLTQNATGGGMPLRGDEDIRVRGVEIARQRDMERSRRLEFLSITANPVDADIIGVPGRAEVLRTLADDLGMPGKNIVPNERELAQKAAQQQMIADQAAERGEPNPNAQSMGTAPKANPS